mmetsp:Transcript_14888/g.28887  ORF Transcript_14888/g.28887 Transcript_14888/m.28887 type:complete len:333 (+) Transcript_14888:768-1766(+)
MSKATDMGTTLVLERATVHKLGRFVKDHGTTRVLVAHMITRPLNNLKRPWVSSRLSLVKLTNRDGYRKYMGVNAIHVVLEDRFIRVLTHSVKGSKFKSAFRETSPLFNKGFKIEVGHAFLFKALTIHIQERSRGLVKAHLGGLRFPKLRATVLFITLIKAIKPFHKLIRNRKCLETTLCECWECRGKIKVTHLIVGGSAVASEDPLTLGLHGSHEAAHSRLALRLDIVHDPCLQVALAVPDLGILAGLLKVFASHVLDAICISFTMAKLSKTIAGAWCKNHFRALFHVETFSKVHLRNKLVPCTTRCSIHIVTSSHETLTSRKLGLSKIVPA